MNVTKSNRLLKTTLLAACCLAFATSSAWATLVTWNLNPSGSNADLGSNLHDFIVSGYTISARGYDNNNGVGSAHELHFKNDGGDEVGLGLRGTPNFELQVNGSGIPLQFIQLDLRSILLQGFTNGQVEVGSVQSGELFNLYGSNALGNLGIKLNSTVYDSSKDNLFVNVPNFGTYQFISVVAAAVDVLPVAFRATIVPVPEAASLVPVICLVVLATAFEVRRRRSS
jgi:hypothetical protein